MILSATWFFIGFGTAVLIAIGAVALGIWVLNCPYKKDYIQEDQQDDLYW